MQAISRLPITLRTTPQTAPRDAALILAWQSARSTLLMSVPCRVGTKIESHFFLAMMYPTRLTLVPGLRQGAEMQRNLLGGMNLDRRDRLFLFLEEAPTNHFASVFQLKDSSSSASMVLVPLDRMLTTVVRGTMFQLLVPVSAEYAGF